MSDLCIKILDLLNSSAPGEFIYLREREELSDYPQDVILGEAEKLAEDGYLKIVKTDGFVEIDNSLVNYFYEITGTGREFLSQLRLKTG